MFEAKFGWTKDETIIYNTILSSSAIVGLAIGSFLGGPLIQIGRRKSAIIANIIGIMSSLISMTGTTTFLTIGRLSLGVAAGIYNVIFGKVILENMPERLAQKLALSHNGSICTGFVFAFGLGSILPDCEDFEASKADELWRVIYLMPAFIGVIGILLIGLIFKYEPI